MLGLTYISIKLIKPNADLSFLLPLHLYSKFFLLTNVGTLPRVSPKMLVQNSVGILSLLRWQNKKKVVNVWSHHHTQWAEKRKKARHSFKMKMKKVYVGTRNVKGGWRFCLITIQAPPNDFGKYKKSKNRQICWHFLIFLYILAFLWLFFGIFCLF